METFDALVVGGGPAGSTAARWLVDAGMRVALLDRAEFPRVKLCAGWLSVPIWDALELSPESYPHGLWEWNKCHVHFGGVLHSITARGFFIRRVEFDNYLLGLCGADVRQHQVKSIERDGDHWVLDGAFRAPYLIGAGGTHCPVARALFPAKPSRPVGARELEFEADPRDVAAHRAGADGEPELLLHSDLRGYSWNIPKTDWINVGCGTMNAKKVHPAWSDARAVFEDSGHVPPSAAPMLDKMKGHSYYLFDPAHLAACERDGAFLVGDSLGLAQPLTAEGILPAVLSGRHCAQAIVTGRPGVYHDRLQRDPTLGDYTVFHRIREAGAALRKRSSSSEGASSSGGNGRTRKPRAEPRNGRRIATPPFVSKLARSAVATGFAWMFSGRPLPARRIFHLLNRV